MRSLSTTTIGLFAALFFVAGTASLTRGQPFVQQAAEAAERREVPQVSASIDGGARSGRIENGPPASKDFDPQPTLAIAHYSHRVRARGHMLVTVDGIQKWIAPKTPFNCTAVSLGGGRFVTAGHLTAGLGGKVEVDVEVDGNWINNVAVTKVPGRDLLYLAISNDVAGCQTRKPEFFEEVTLYGLKTATPQTGIYAGDRHVALRPDEPGIDFGDSGGGVFGVDGKLVGIIRGFGNDGTHSVYITVVDDPPLSAVTPPPPGIKCPSP